MRESDLFFRFPTFSYMASELEESSKVQKLLDPDIEVGMPDPINSWEKCRIDQITSWRPSFSAGRSREEIEAGGFDITVIEFEGMKDDSVSSWPVEIFERHYNNHQRFLRKTKIKRKIAHLRDLFF